MQTRRCKGSIFNWILNRVSLICVTKNELQVLNTPYSESILNILMFQCTHLEAHTIENCWNSCSWSPTSHCRLKIEFNDHTNLKILPIRIRFSDNPRQIWISNRTVWCGKINLHFCGVILIDEGWCLVFEVINRRVNLKRGTKWIVGYLE